MVNNKWQKEGSEKSWIDVKYRNKHRKNIFNDCQRNESTVFAIDNETIMHSIVEWTQLMY